VLSSFKDSNKTEICCTLCEKYVKTKNDSHLQTYPHGMRYKGRVKNE